VEAVITTFQDGSEVLLTKFGNEVRHTLHNVMGWIELTAEERLSETQARRLAQCRDAADRLFRISNDVAELASPFRPAAPRSFELKAMVEEVAEITSMLASRRDLQFLSVMEPGTPAWVVADREAVQDMLRRILDNSIRFTGEGIVTLTVSARSQAANSATVIFEILDTGPGIPREVLDQLQEAAGVSPLRGLGLEIVRRRALAMKGELTCVTSVPGGTTARITLPMQVDLARTASAAESSRAAQQDVAPLRLLVVEDSEDSFALLQAYVKEEGHQISRAWNGAEAVSMAKAGPYDLILMDVCMPVMDGYEATRTIREWETQQRRGRTPIVLLSAESAARQTRIGSAAGCSGYLTKPTTRSQVLQALHFYGSPAPSDPSLVR
jgi:CheY-like chemotaxis protein